MSQNRTEKVPNVPSEFLEKMSFSQPFPLFQSPISSPAASAAAAANRRVARAPPGTKTARHGRTNMSQNRTEKVPNVPSELPRYFGWEMAANHQNNGHHQ